MSTHNKWKVKHRIACEEVGYGINEARFISISDYILFLAKASPINEDAMVGALNRYYTEAFNKGFDKAESMAEYI